MSSIKMPGEAIEPSPQVLADPRRTRAKRILIGFLITTILGFALAGWYVGGRILAVERVHAAVAAKPVVATPAPAPVTAIAVPASPVVEAQATALTPAGPKPAGQTPAWAAVDPQPGESYLQLAAMGPRSTQDYLQTLAGKGMHARVAPGPSANLYRIVLGPYPDQSALDQEQQALRTAGIETFARVY